MSEDTCRQCGLFLELDAGGRCSGCVRSDHRLTVAQLVALLVQCPQDMRVQVEGCDCVGDAYGIMIDQGFGAVTVMRWEHEERPEFMAGEKVVT